MDGMSKAKKGAYPSPAKKDVPTAAGNGATSKFGFSNSPFRSNVTKTQPVAPAVNGLKNMTRAKSPPKKEPFTVGCRVVVNSKQGLQPRSGVVLAVCFGSLKVQTANGSTVVANKSECVLDHSFRPPDKVPQTTKEARSTSKERHPRPVISTRLRSPERFKSPERVKSPPRSTSAEKTKQPQPQPPKRMSSPPRTTSPKRAVTAIHRAPKVTTDGHTKPRRERSPIGEERRDKSPGAEDRKVSSGKHARPRGSATPATPVTPPPRKKKTSDFSSTVRSNSSSAKKRTKSNTHSHVQPRQADYYNRVSSVPPMPAKNMNFGEGGYGHVMAGDVLNHQYQVIKQVGRGQSSTVWLAQDKTLKSGNEYEFVAIKVTKCAPNVVSSALHEVALLYYLARNNPYNSNYKDKLDSGGVSRLLNHFEHRGLYGTHVCMVFELLGPSLDVLMAQNGFKGIKDVRLVKEITVSILKTLRQLKAVNVVHTDLKPENLMFEKITGDTERVIRKHVDPQAAEEGERKTLWREVKEDSDVKISDFGLSFLLRPRNGLRFTGEPLDDTDLKLIRASNYMKGALIQTREYRAPEIILGNDFGCETDIWSLGCIVFEMMTGKFLFDPKSKPNITSEYDNDIEHLSEISQLLGRPPVAVLRTGVYTHRFYDPNDRFKSTVVNKIPDIKGTLLRRTTKEEALACYNFVMQCLSWCPSQRPTADKLLEHPWLRCIFEQEE